MSDSSTSKEMNEEDYKNLLSEVLAVTMATMIKTLVKNKNKTIFPMNTIKSNLVQLPDKYNVPFKEDKLKMNGFLNDILMGLKSEHAIFVCKEKTKWDRNGPMCFLLTDQFYLVVCSSFDVFQAAVEKAIKITENSVERTPIYEETISSLSNYFVNLAIKTTTQMTPFDPNYVVWAFSHHLLSEYHAFTFVRTILCLDILWEMKNDKRLKHDRTNGVFRVRLAESAASLGSDSSEPEEVPQLIKNMLSLPSEKFIHKAPPRPAVQNSQTSWTSIVSGASSPAVPDATTASENSADTVPSATATNTVAASEPNVAGPPGILPPPGLKGPPGLPIHTPTAPTPSVGAEGSGDASAAAPPVVWTVAMIMAEKEERERVAKQIKANGQKKQTSTAAVVTAPVPVPVASTPLVYVSKNVEPKAEPTTTSATEKTTEGRKSKKESANAVPNLDIVERLAVPFTEIILKRLKTTEPFMCHDFRALLNDKNNLKKFNMQPFINRDQVLVVADAIRDVVRKNKALVFDPKYVNPKNGQKIEVFWSADSQKASESAEIVGEKLSAQKTASDKSVEKSVKIGDRSVEKSVEKSSNDKANASKKESKQDTSKSVATKASTTNANSRGDQGKASKESASTTAATATTNTASGYDVYSSPMYIATTKRLARYFIDKAQEMVSAGQTYIVASILQVLRSAVDIVTTVENADKVKVTKVVSLSDLYELHAVEATRLMRDVVAVMRDLDILQFTSRDTFELGYFSVHKWGQSDTKKSSKVLSVFESANSSFATAPASTVFAAPGLAPQTVGVKTEAHQTDKKTVETDDSVDGTEQSSMEMSAVPEILTPQQLLQQEQMTSLAAKHNFIPPKAPVGLSSPPHQGFGPHFGSPPSRPLAGPHSGHQQFQSTATGLSFVPSDGLHFEHMGPLSRPPPTGQHQHQQQQSDGNGPPLSFDEFMRMKATNGMHNPPPRPMAPALNVPHMAPHMAQHGVPNMHPMSAFHQSGYQGGHPGPHQYPGPQISHHNMHRGPPGGGAGGSSIPAHLLHSGLAKHKPPQSFDPTSVPSGLHKMPPQQQFDGAAGGAPLSFQDFVQQMAMGEIGVRPHPHAVPPPQHTQHSQQHGMFQPPVPSLSSPEVPFISTMGSGVMHSTAGFSGMLPPPHATHPVQSKQPSFVPLPTKGLPVQPLHAGPQPESYEAFLMRTSKGGKGAVKAQEKQKITPNQLKPQYAQHAGLFSAAPSAVHQPLPMMERPDHFPPAVQSGLASGPVGIESSAIPTTAPPKKLSTDAPVFVPVGGFVVPTSATVNVSASTTTTTTAATGSSTSVPGLSNPLINLSVLQNAVKTVASSATTSSSATTTAAPVTTATTVETAAVQGLSNPLINLSVLKNAVKTVASNGAATAATTTAVDAAPVSVGLSNPLINPLINSSILKNAVQTVASSMAGNSEFSLTTATDATATTGGAKPQSTGSPPKTTKQSTAPLKTSSLPAGAAAKKEQEEEPMLVDYLAQQLQTQQALDSRANAILSGFPSVASDGTAEVGVKRSVIDDFAAFFTTQQGPPSSNKSESAAKSDLTDDLSVFKMMSISNAGGANGNASHNSSFSSAARPQLADELWQSLDGDW